MRFLSILFIFNFIAANGHAACNLASEVSFSDLQDGSLAKELGLSQDQFRSRFQAIFDFFEFGGKGHIVKFIDHYGLKLIDAGKVTLDSGPYVIIQQFPTASSVSKTLWLHDSQVLEQLKSLSNRLPIILEYSPLSRASVVNLEESDGLSQSHEFKRCGFLPASTKFSMTITGMVNNTVLVHESVHLSDDESGLDNFFQALKQLKSNHELSEDAYYAVDHYVMEQRAYATELEYLKNESKGELEQELQIARNAFRDEYKPRLLASLQGIRNPDTLKKVRDLIEKNLFPSSFDIF